MVYIRLFFGALTILGLAGVIWDVGRRASKNQVFLVAAGPCFTASIAVGLFNVAGLAFGAGGLVMLVLFAATARST